MPVTSSNATKQDVKLLKHDISLVRRELGLLRDELKGDTRKAIELVEARMGKNFESYRDDVLTKFDAVMKELESMREESTLGLYQTNNLSKKIDGHEKRIAKLEST